MLKDLSSFSIFLFLGLFCFVHPVLARENVTDWYIKDLRAEFILSPDSTMTVTEWIIADCGRCTGKHGIFRIVPTETHTENDTIKTPVKLLGITDFQGKKYNYTETENRSDATLTWKIGDPDVTVTGVHQYKIVYQIRNVIRFSDQKFDEFYWNINGNFWTLDVDAFTATVVFPETIDKETAELSIYTGLLGSKRNDLVNPTWQNGHVLSFVATQPLQPGEGITISVTFPKGLFMPYRFGWWESYGTYLWFLFPVIVFWFCFRIWRKYGDDPKWGKVVIPEYEVPEHLDTLELGLLSTNGRMDNQFVTAALIELAVKGYIKIREESQKILFFTTTDFILEKQPVSEGLLSPHQRILFDKLFESGDQVKLSLLKNEFYKVLPDVKEAVMTSLSGKGMIETKGLTYRTVFLVIGGMFLGLAFALMTKVSLLVGLAVLSGGVIFMGFAIIMPKRTLEGTEVNWKIKGLKLYMDTAEKYRQQFYEKENIFETLLPYAIVFGMTREWIKKMRDIYGEAYFSHYHPVWFSTSGIGNFDVESFTSHLEALSSSMAANTGTSSGSGGSGSSGGGGGGGGGGGW